MKLIQAQNPDVKKIGLLYDVGQDSSTTAIQEAKDYLDKDASDKEISDQEWQELIVSMDSQWNNAISRFHVKYQLSKEELYLVCLSLTDFPFAHLAYLMHSSRRTLYRKKNALCERIVVEQNSEFKEILRKI